MQGDGILTDIGVAIVAAAALAYVARLLRQPVLLAYIGAGLLVGPPGLGLVHNDLLIAELSNLGLALLLFIVGLEIDLKKLVRSSRVAAPVGAIQVVLSALLAVACMHALGFGALPALYLGVASAFSSTMIVVKLLSDKSEMDTVEGRLILGILIVQDVLSILVLALQPNLDDPSLAPMALSVASGLALVAGALAAARWVLPPLFRWASTSPEILLLSAVAWCLVVGYLAVLANFSIAMGALVAGVALSAFPYTLDVVAKIRGLRDFFVTLFFVALGMQLQLGEPRILIAAAVLSAAIIASRFLTLGPALYAFGYGPRVAILGSLSLAQAGEFSLIIPSVGLALGHIGPDIVSIVVLALVLTSTLSTYMLMANHRIARRGVALLARLGIADRGAGPEAAPAERAAPEIVLLGFHRAASSLLHDAAEPLDRPFVVVDFSPEVHRRLRERGVPVLYGDISHLDTLEQAGVRDAHVVVSTVSDDFLRGTSNAALLRQVRRLNPNARVILSAETLHHARDLYAAGADYVVLPRREAGHAFRAALGALERGELDDLRARAVAELDDRDEVIE